MTGDRSLTEHEKRLFLAHDGSMDAISIIREKMFEGGEPTLHDVALIEMLAKIESHTNFIIQHGSEIEVLKNLRSLIVLAMDKMKDLDKKLESWRELLELQVRELREAMKDLEEQE